MEAIVSTRGLTKEYKKVFGRKKVVALDGLDLEIQKGEIFGLLGPNGSGKTTTLKLLLGIISPTKGEAFVLGKPVRDIHVKGRIGYMPESPYFYQFLNPVELLGFYGELFSINKKERRKRIDELLELVGLSPYRNRVIRNFSKGMLQRIGIAQALLNDAELLFLDEPTIGLDPVGTMEMKSLFSRLKGEGKTILLSSHLLSEVEKSCDRVGILYNGRMVKLGSIQELLSVQDEVQITTKELSDEAKKKIERIVEENGSKVLRFDNPRESLESLFLRVIEDKKNNLSNQKMV